MEFNISEAKTKSGASLWTFSSPNYNSVLVGVLVKCGARDEIWPKEAGIAHALEHMPFLGTQDFSDSMKVSGHIEEIGGRIGAFTNSERTFFYSRAPIGFVERAIHIVNELVEKSIFPEEKVVTELKNIIQETRRRNDDPRRYLGLLSRRFIYNNHPLSRDVLGTEESVSAFVRSDFLKFKKRYYNPANYVFIAFGNIKENEALKLFNKYFDGKAEISPNKREKIELTPRQDKQFIENKDLKQLHISIDALIGEGKDKSSLYLEFFRDMISGGMSFPLSQELRNKRGLCYSAGATVIRRSDIGNFNIYIGTDHKRHKEAIPAALEVIEKSKSDEALLNKVKNLKLGKLMLAYEDIQNVIYLVLDDILFFGRPRGFEEIKREIEEVTTEDIRKAVDKYLNPDSIFITMLAPKDFTVD